MRITDTIIRALQSAAKETGNIHQLAIKSGLPTETVRRWINNTVSSIDDAKWMIIFPYLQKHFTPLELACLNAGTPDEAAGITMAFHHDQQHGQGSYDLVIELEKLEKLLPETIHKKHPKQIAQANSVKKRIRSITYSLDFLEAYNIEYPHWKKLLDNSASGYPAENKPFYLWCADYVQALDMQKEKAIKGEIEDCYYSEEFVIHPWVRKRLIELKKEYGNQISRAIMMPDMIFSGFADGRIDLIRNDQLRKLEPLLLDSPDGEDSKEFYTQGAIRRIFNHPDCWTEVGRVAFYNLPGKTVEECIAHQSELKNEWENIRNAIEPQRTAMELKSAMAEDFVCVPVISEAAALTWNSALVPLMDFIGDNATSERISFPQAKSNDHIVKIIGDSMSPWYPAGTYVLVRPSERVRNGSRVIAKLITGEIVFKVFVQKQDKVILMAINEVTGKNLEFNINELFAYWIWPIKWSFRNEDDLDAEMSKHGIRHRWESIAKE